MAEQYKPQAQRNWQAATSAARTAALRTRAGAFQASLHDQDRHQPEADPAGLAAACAHAEEFFTGHMRGSWAPDYLTSRGFDAAIQQEWAAGYAPAGWTKLTDHLRGLGHSNDAIEGAGLAIRSSRGTLVDLFRDRVMLPIRSEHGTTVAFIGRAAPGTADEKHHKYLNTPSTDLYHKSEVLFGLPQASGRIAVGAQPVIVEGPFDAIAVCAANPEQLAGLAPCGTALTIEQVAALARIADLNQVGAIIALDGDGAGRRGMIAAYPVLSAITDQTFAAVLPPGTDPAEFLRTAGPTALADELSRRIQPLADIVIDTFINQRVADLSGVRTYDGAEWTSAWEGRNILLYEAARHVVSMPPMHWQRQINRIAVRFHLPLADAFRAFLAAHTAVTGINALEDQPAENTPKHQARWRNDQRAAHRSTAAPAAPPSSPATPADRAAAGFPASPSHRMASSKQSSPIAGNGSAELQPAAITARRRTER